MFPPKNLKLKCASGFYFQQKYTQPNLLCPSLFLPKQDARNRASCFDDLCFSILILPHALCHTPRKIKKFAYIEPFGYRTAIRSDLSLLMKRCRCTPLSCRSFHIYKAPCTIEYWPKRKATKNLTIYQIVFGIPNDQTYTFCHRNDIVPPRRHARLKYC